MPTVQNAVKASNSKKETKLEDKSTKNKKKKRIEKKVKKRKPEWRKAKSCKIYEKIFQNSAGTEQNAMYKKCLAS